MLSREKIEKIAVDYLIKNKYPIVIPGKVTMPEDRSNENIKNFLLDKKLSMVSFKSKHLDDPEHELDPGAYIVYVNLITGEVHMPRHM